MKNLLSENYISHYRRTLLLAYPVVLSQLGHIMVGVVDTAMVGQIGTIPQAAVALSNSLYALVLVFGLGVSFGVTPLVAAAASTGKLHENASLLKHGIIINTLLGIALYILLSAISPVLGMFHQNKEVVDAAIPFLNVMMLGMIPLCIFSGFKQFAEGLSYTKIAMLISVGANLVNIILNYLMIFGHLGFPAMGMMGACWATFISRVLMAFAMFVYIGYNKHFKQYWKGFSKIPFSKDLTKKILAIGVPSGLQWVFEVGAFSFAIIMIGWIGPDEQAAHQVALSVAAITYMMASGLSAAASVRVGNQFGLKNREGIRTAGFSAWVIVLLFMSISALCMILFKNQLPLLFNHDRNVVAIAASLLVIAAFFQLSDGAQVVGLGALRGMKDVKIPTIITLVAYWVIGLPMSYVFAFPMHLGVQGVWYGLALGLTVAAILLYLRFNHITKKV
jgi:MATE family multidrug resistance protein